MVSEVTVQNMIKYIDHENPVIISASYDKPEKLHNIITQEIMAQEICDDLLQFETKFAELYVTFRNEKFVKERDTFDTIHINNLRTFKSNEVVKETWRTENNFPRLRKSLT